MIRPAVLNPRPSFILTVLGGVVAMLLFSALLHLAPAAGLPFLDLPRLIGGIFVSEPRAAFWLGYWLFFLTGALVGSELLCLAWSVLPGPAVGFGGALLKGALWSLLTWAATGLLLPLFSLLNGVEHIDDPGFFGLGAGISGAVVLLVGFIAYGVTLALIAAMGQDIKPLAALGWKSFEHAETDLTVLAAFRERTSLSGAKK